MKRISAHLIIAILLSVVIVQCGSGDQLGAGYKDNGLIVLAGGTNISNMQYHGFLEAIIQASFPTKKLRVRNLAWDGDTVFEQFRDLNFGSWAENIDSLEADIVFVQFGQMEALGGAAGIDSFELAYRRLLEQVEKKGRKLILLSPTPFDPGKLEQVSTYGLKNPLDNTMLEKYAASIQRLAQEKNCLYIDLFTPLKKNGVSLTPNEGHPGSGSSSSDESRPDSESINPTGSHLQGGSFTFDGIHLTEEGHKQVASLIAQAIGLEHAYTSEMEPLRKAIIAKNEIWFNYWRPGNWAFLKGDRTHVQFSRDWRDVEKRIFPDEMKAFQPLLESSEQQIYQLATDGDHPEGEEPAAQSSYNDSSTRRSIEEEMASFTVAKGFSIELYASEEQGVIKPTAMRWDEQGRLWVLTSPTYPQLKPGSTPGDRLIVLQDINADGRPDRSKVFADHLNIPLGFELGNGGVYLGEQTRLLFLPDADNDLRADTIETLFSGFGTSDAHQTINSFTWSPSGELFFSQGYHIFSRIETPWGIRKSNRASIWRYRPRLAQLDNFLDEATASDNPWGLNFDDWGRVFNKSNAQGLFFTSPGLILHSQKSMLPQIGAASNKSGIIEIVRSPHFPDSMQHDFLVAGYYNNRIDRLKVVEDGSGYAARLMEPLLVSSGTSFRPVDIKTGPDGAVYVLDWYNPVIGHYQASMRDPSRDKTHGRIWKITADNRPLSKQPDLAGQPVATLLEHLKTGEYWTRYQVRRLLSALPSGEVEPALADWIEELNPRDRHYETCLREAMFVYMGQELVNEKLLNSLLRSPNADARALAAQAVERWWPRLPAPLNYLSALINDPSPNVRLMAVVAAGNIPKAESVLIALKALDHPTDKFILYALEKAVNALKNDWSPAVRDGLLNIKNNSHLAFLIGKTTPEWAGPELYHKLLRRQPETRSPIYAELLRGLAGAAGPEDIEFIIRNAFNTKHPEWLDMLSKMGKKPITERSAAYLKEILVTGMPADMKRSALLMVRAWNIESLYQPAMELFRNKKENMGVRIESLNFYVTQKGVDAIPLLKEYLRAGDTAPQIKFAALKGLSGLDPALAAAQGVSRIEESGWQPEAVERVVSLMKADTGLLQQFADRIMHLSISKPQAQVLLRALSAGDVDDLGFIDHVSKIAGENRAALHRTYDEQYIARLKQNVVRNGNVQKGKEIYDNLTCASCHIIGKEGGTIGPDLSSVGSGLTLGDLITEVLWPNRNIKEGYNTVMIRMKNGESVQGVKAYETNHAITLKDAGGGQTRIDKSGIAGVTELGSVMPEGLTNHLSEEELVHLVQYLSELRH